MMKSQWMRVQFWKLSVHNKPFSILLSYSATKANSDRMHFDSALSQLTNALLNVCVKNFLYGTALWETSVVFENETVSLHGFQ